MKNPAARTRDRELWIAGGLWGLWAVLPSLMIGGPAVKSAAVRAFITAQVGTSAVPYLGAAPRGALTYLLASDLGASIVLVLLAQRVRRAAAGAPSSRETVTLALRRVGVFAAMYLVGAAIVGVVMRVRGVPSQLVWGWAPRLALFGLVTTLPQVGWIFAVGLNVRRLWLSLVVTVFGVIGCGVASHVLAAREIAFPAPASLRAELLAGRAELVVPALLGLVIWGLGLLLVGVGIRELRAHRLMRAAAISA
jgi:hypothetical protein